MSKKEELFKKLAVGKTELKEEIIRLRKLLKGAKEVKVQDALINEINKAEGVFGHVSRLLSHEGASTPQIDGIEWKKDKGKKSFIFGKLKELFKDDEKAERSFVGNDNEKKITREKSDKELVHLEKTKDVGENASVGFRNLTDEVDYHKKMANIDDEKYQRIVGRLKEGNYTYERDEDDIYYLAKAIWNENKYVGMDAIRALEKIRDPQTILILRGVIRDNKNEYMRMH
ncbi:MAG: hypothetical protein KAI55_04330, partial [Candidatus Aenigmarchaeota archaeon]|nr:hypothetical protein [Candidatus Aenigmarchaeota archaeon]